MHGVIRMTLPNPRFIERIHSTVGPLISNRMPLNPIVGSIYEISVAIGDPETIPPLSKLLAKSEIYDEGLGVMVSTDDYIWLIFDGKISLKIKRGQMRAWIIVHPEHERRIAGSCLLLAIEDALDYYGQFILHAASLRLPDQDMNILIYAPSGTGKTTTTLSLLSEGFGLCSDDATILKIENGVTTGWGFPRHLKVHKNTAFMLPWLTPLLTNEWDKEGEQPLARKDLGVSYSVYDKDPQTILGIFSLVRTSGDQCVAEPLSTLEATIELTADNVRVGSEGLLPVQERRLDNIINMVSNIQVFKLSVGSDLKAISPEIARVLALKN